MRGTPGSANPQPEPNATGLPSSAQGRPELVELRASARTPMPTRAEENIASAPSPGAPRRRELRTWLKTSSRFVPSPAAARRRELRTSPGCRLAALRAARLRRRVPSHLQSLYEVWHGADCQIRRQAGHGAAHSLGTHLAAGSSLVSDFLERQ